MAGRELASLRTPGIQNEADGARVTEAAFTPRPRSRPRLYDYRTAAEMRKSNIGRGSIQQHGVLKPRNGDFTPNRLSAGMSARRSYIHKMGQADSAKRVGRVMRKSTDNTGRPTLLSSRITPTRQNTSAFVPQSANRMATDSCRRSGTVMSTRKDSRPMSDPAYKTQCISKILEFLTHNGYPHPIQRRTLNTPTTKDFTNIFTFIIQQLDPSYVLPPRYEEEIPKLLKLLMYPVQMTKSSFVTVGSPHTWPAVLAMLVFLVDLALAYSCFSQDTLSPPCYEDDEMYGRDHIFVSLYKCKDDEISACLKEYGENLRAEFGVTEKGMMELQREGEAADETLESLSETSQELEQLKQCCSQYCDDLKKMRSYCQDLQVVVQNKTAQVNNSEQRLEELNAEKIMACEEVADLEKLQAQQSLSSTDLIHFKNHSQEVGKQIEQQDHLGSDLQSQVWNRELEVSRAQPNLGSLYALFEDLLKQVKMDDVSDILSNCNDLKLCFDDMIFKITIHKKAVKKGTSQAEVKKWEMEQDIDTVKKEMQIKLTERKKLETKIRHNEEELKVAQEETAQEVQARMEEIESLHQHILEARKTHNKPFYQLQRTDEEKTRVLENYKKKKEVCVRDGSEFLMKIFNMALQSAQVRESIIADYINHINVECDKFQELLDNVEKLDK